MQVDREVSAGNTLKFQEFQVLKEERFIDMNLYQFGWQRCEPLHTFGPATRSHFLFHYVFSGKGRLTTNDQTYCIHAGQGFLLCPGQLASYSADANDPWNYAWLEFDGLRARGSVTLAGLSETAPVYVPMNAEAEQQVREQMLYIISHPASSPIRMVGHMLIFLDQLMQSSNRKASPGGRCLRDFYLKEAIAFIDANYQRGLSIEEIASACGLNRSYFGRLFKEGMGKSPQQFLLHYRMAKAAEMLKSSRLPIRDVGAAVGYENQLHFSRAFKSVFHVAPREYRQRHFIHSGQ